MPRRPGSAWRRDPTPQPVPMNRVLQAFCLLWAGALAVVLLVPDLHEGARAWWPSVCLAGLVLGVLGWMLVSRGVGRAKPGEPANR